MKAQQRSLAFVGVGFVALAAAVALGLIWRVAGRVERQLAQFGAALPAPTQFVLEARTGASLLVLGVLIAAAFLHRHPRATLMLVLFGLFELSIAGAYGWALWLPWQPPHSIIR